MNRTKCKHKFSHLWNKDLDYYYESDFEWCVKCGTLRIYRPTNHTPWYRRPENYKSKT
jgi:hypothetical protein